MKTRAFCRKFDACRAGTKFALKFDTMRDCYAALLAGDAGANSTEWAIWAATRPGVMSDRDQRMFAVRCAWRVQHLMTDARSVTALDVAERYANGEATAEELSAARATARAAARDAAMDAARDEERKAQLEILAEFGNPFEEEKKKMSNIEDLVPPLEL